MSTYQAKIQCGNCGNDSFRMTLSVFEEQRAIISECICGRRVEYRVSDVIDHAKLMRHIGIKLNDADSMVLSGDEQ